MGKVQAEELKKKIRGLVKYTEAEVDHKNLSEIFDYIDDLVK